MNEWLHGPRLTPHTDRALFTLHTDIPLFTGSRTEPAHQRPESISLIPPVPHRAGRNASSSRIECDVRFRNQGTLGSHTCTDFMATFETARNITSICSALARFVRRLSPPSVIVHRNTEDCIRNVARRIDTVSEQPMLIHSRADVMRKTWQTPEVS